MTNKKSFYQFYSLKKNNWSHLTEDVATNDDVDEYYDSKRDHEFVTLSNCFGSQFDGLYGDDLCRALLQSLLDEGGEITSCHDYIGSRSQDIHHRLLNIGDGLDDLTQQETDCYYFLQGTPVFEIAMVQSNMVIRLNISSVLKRYSDAMSTEKFTMLEFEFSKNQLTWTALKAAGFQVPYEHLSGGRIINPFSVDETNDTRIASCKKFEELKALITDSEVIAKCDQFKEWLSAQNLTISEYFDLAALVFKIFGLYNPVVDERCIIRYGQSVKANIWPDIVEGPKYKMMIYIPNESFGIADTTWSPEILESENSFETVNNIVRSLFSFCSRGDAGIILAFVTSLKAQLVSKLTNDWGVGTFTTIRIDRLSGELDATMSADDLWNLRLTGVDFANFWFLSGGVIGGTSRVPRDSMLQVTAVLQRYIESYDKGTGISMLARNQALSRATAEKLALQGMRPLDGPYSPDDIYWKTWLIIEGSISDDEILSNHHNFLPWLRSRYGIDHEKFMEILKSAYYYAGLTLPQKTLDEVITVGQSDEARAYTIILDIKFLLTSKCKRLQSVWPTQASSRVCSGKRLSEDDFQRLLSEVKVRIEAFDRSL